MSWKTLPLTQIHIELSSHCNAACPNCARYHEHTLLVRPDLKLKSISLEEFKRYFPVEVLQGLERITFCGTMGDPIMAKDCYDIFQYVYSINPTCLQRVHTNGGMRDEKFWSNMGVLFNPINMQVVFSIDGLEHTNHLYRRNVDWHKLMQNVKAFIGAGGMAYWEWLIFGHNEDQIEEGRALAKELGFIDFITKRAFGFDNPHLKSITPMPAYDRNGNLEYKLYPPKRPEYQNSHELSIFKDIDFPQQDLTEFNEAKEIKFFPRMKFRVDTCRDSKSTELGDYASELNSKSIKCRSHFMYDKKKYSEVYVNASGLLLPCCFVGSRYDANIDYFIDNQLKTKVNAGKDDLDLNIRNIKEIIDSEILDKIFTESWKLSSISEGKIAFCSETCGNNSAMDKLYFDQP
jgi:hypothetical protein